MRRMLTWVLAIGFTVLSVDTIRAQSGQYPSPPHYPSQEQEARDHWECHRRAVEQTGYDPSFPQDAAPRGHIAAHGKAMAGESAKAAAGSAAVGAAAGAVAGNAGKWAAVGAAAGGVHGLLRGLGTLWGREQDKEDKQLQRFQGYQRALSACMEVRGYHVK
jgi:hypothetical protein